MAKVSTKPITTIDDDWGNDGTGLPYSGQAVQDFIKQELKEKVTQTEAGNIVSNQLRTQLFGGGTRGVVTAVDGTSQALTITSVDADNVSSTNTINISTPDVNDRIVTVQTQLTSPAINVGGEVSLAFGFSIADYQNNVIPNSFANVEIRVTRQGAVNPFYTQQLGSLAASEALSHSIELTNIIAQNVTGNASVIVTVVVNHTYEYEDEGVKKTKTITKYGTSTLTVLALTLVTPISILNIGLSGQVSIPYTVRGNGNKTVYLYKNGVIADQHTDILSASSSGTFVISGGLPTGITNFQLVAESTQAGVTVRSSSHYFDLFGTAANTVICLKVEDFTGAIQGPADYMSPKFSAAKFSDFQMDYYAYNPSSQSLQAVVLTEELNEDGQVIVASPSEQTLNRAIYTYSKRIKSSNSLRVTFTIGSTTKVVTINPLASSINIELPTDSLKLNLDADGRNNGEVNPAVWNYGEVTTLFEGLNWQSNGWVTDEGSIALLLQNGAKATINYPLFQSVDNIPVTRNGCTFEILFKCANATLEENDIISCYWTNNLNRETGLKITTNYVGVNTGEVTEYTSEDKKDDQGNPIVTRVVTRVGSQYAQNNYYKFTFVIDPNAPGIGGNKGLCYGYLNGILSYVAPIPSSFINLRNLPIVIDSTHADVYVKSIKYYDAPLTHDQCVDEYIIDQTSAAKIEELYKNNEVLGKDALGKEYLSPQKLRTMGRGVMIISPSTEQTSVTYLQDLNKSSNKKSYYGPFRVDYFAPEYDLNLGYTTTPLKGNAFNFTHTQCAIRIQGTTSTKRPRKNYRLHFNKKDKDNKPAKGSFIVGGEVRDSFKYAMSQGAVEVPIACLKVDYVDSSMTHNTGGAVIFNELTRNVASLRNPAQQREFVNSATDIKTRVAIEGFPIDVFAATRVINPAYTNTLEDSNYENLEYMGQYNYNNDKSKSGKVFGFDGSYTYDEDGTYNPDGAYQPICLEFLDNYTSLDLFQMKFTPSGTLDEAASYAPFNKALEVRAPADVTDHVAGSSLDDLATSEFIKDDKGVATADANTFKWVPGQIKRVFNFVGECAKEVAKRNGISPYSLNNMTSDQFEALNWTCPKFTSEAEDYFNMASICAWYIWTDYLIAVDQRAKNMMLYTMDGKHWMLQYYDGDTMLGERNDCFLAYDYLTDRDTYDEAVGQYALQGHDSWLWYLVRANFDSMLTSVCRDMRGSGKFSANYFKQILNGQFVNSWSQRQYNYSQDYKYIQPLTEDFSGTDIGTNFINTAQGSREAHRTYTLENRFNLLDSKYKTNEYASDAFAYYGREGVNNELTIVSSIPFYFGWVLTGQSITTGLQQHKAANAANNYTVKLNITGNGANNPAAVLGASRIKELTFAPNSAWTVDASKDVRLPNLQKLVAKNITAAGPLYLTDCPLLTYLDLSGSAFTGLEGLQNSSKLQYIDVSGTGISSVRFADGSPIETIKLATPVGLYLSNLSKVVYNGGDYDTISAENWNQLSELLVNNCPQVDWEKLVEKIVNSTAEDKFLRITGIDKTASLSWLDQFEGFYGLDSSGRQITTSAQLIGNLHLPDYTDDTLVKQYQDKYPTLNIMQPEYTIIEADESITDERPFNATITGNITNLDNNTGARNSTKYVPSGHITNILSRCHRYLGKLVSKGNPVQIPTNPNATDKTFLNARDKQGTMYLIQLEDKDSRYFASGYNSASTRREANLSGLKTSKHGEVYVKIPGFWYKGINLLFPAERNVQVISRKYTCYSSQETKPSVSTEIKVLSVNDLKAVEVQAGTEDEGLYRENRVLGNTNAANTVDERISATANNSYDIIRIKVEGYKKVRYPLSVGQTCCVFTDVAGKIITDITGSVVGVGEIYIPSGIYGYNGMPATVTIPAGAKWFYIAVPKYITGSTTTDPCDIVLHKGSKFNSGEEMTVENAKEWIADMEPEWVYSEPVCIAAAEAASGDSLTLYTSFDGSKTAATGSGNAEVPDINVKGQWFQHSMSEAAFLRGLQLIDYEASKLIAMLFVAKYGRRNSQNVLGAGSALTARKLGVSREYGMVDTTIPLNIAVAETWDNAAIPIASTSGQITYKEISTPVFLGIENIHGNIQEWLDRAFMANETAANCGKIRITEPDLSTRRVFAYSPSSYYPTAVVHGRFCDICSCSGSGASTATGYCDFQVFDFSINDSWSKTKALLRSAGYADSGGGVFYLSSDYSVGFSHTSFGSRLQFRGNMIETSDVDYYINLPEVREN